jgi:5-methyltetrahydrofolate--homocysteine methyltransferase
VIRSIYANVLEGNSAGTEILVKTALSDHTTDDIMNKGLLAALDSVGRLYSTGEYFLPQMIASANAMKKGFDVLKPLLSKKSSRGLGRVVICTVRGDVHDIGKNIVALMLENHGFDVHDLGKDVPAEKIIEYAGKINAGIIALSSLLTTTMSEMKIISGIIEKEKLPTRLLIGGAVVNEEYAQDINAVFGKDAFDAVVKAKTLAAGT